jgi:hypothetical protein
MSAAIPNAKGPATRTEADTVVTPSDATSASADRVSPHSAEGSPAAGVSTIPHGHPGHQGPEPGDYAD